MKSKYGLRLIHHRSPIDIYTRVRIRGPVCANLKAINATDAVVRQQAVNSWTPR